MGIDGIKLAIGYNYWSDGYMQVYYIIAFTLFMFENFCDKKWKINKEGQ